MPDMSRADGTAPADAADTYRRLTDGPAGAGSVAEDRHVFAAVLALGLAERAAGLGPLVGRLGVPGAVLAAIGAIHFPGADLPERDAEAPLPPADQAALTTLLLWRGPAAGAESRWLAAIVARRSLEPHHLWQDLGLRSRAELSALMGRHFPRLRALNDTNMRWKKFFYRQICNDPGLAVCLAPTCDDCEEKNLCFGPEEGPALLRH